MSNETKARASSPGGWGRWGSSSEGPRYAKPVKGQRRHCPFCRTNRVTHCGLANGVPLCTGCEMCIARWVKGGYEVFDWDKEPCRVCPDSRKHHPGDGPCDQPGCTCGGFTGGGS